MPESHDNISGDEITSTLRDVLRSHDKDISGIKTDQGRIIERLEGLGRSVQSLAASVEHLSASSVARYRTNWGTVAAWGALLLAAGAGLWGAAIRPIANDVSRHDADNKERDHAIFDLAKATTKFESSTAKSFAEVESQIGAMRREEFMRVAYEHTFVKMLWKQQRGEDLPDIPAFMQGSESWTH